MTESVFDIANMEESIRSAAVHETAHAYIASLAGIRVVSISLRRTQTSNGVCRHEGIRTILAPWDLDFFSPRSETTGMRETQVERLKTCISALMETRNISLPEWLRLIRAELCILLAGYATENNWHFIKERAWPKGHDFDLAEAFFQWLSIFGDHSSSEHFLNLVSDAFDEADEMLLIADSLIESRYIGRRRLAKMLPKALPNWPPTEFVVSSA